MAAFFKWASKHPNETVSVLTKRPQLPVFFVCRNLKYREPAIEKQPVLALGSPENKTVLSATYTFQQNRLCHAQTATHYSFFCVFLIAGYFAG